MKYVSTRGQAPPVSLSEAIARGLAPDGGLYIPRAMPSLSAGDFDGAEDPRAIARVLLRPFLAADRLCRSLADIVTEAVDFKLPLRSLEGPVGDAQVLELFHGPTAAFKDLGAQWLAACLSRLHRDPERPLTIIVATSGDTGGAVAAAFHRRPGTEVVILYPAGLVSPRQERQLTAWGDNVRALRVRGSFDDCQRLAKQAFGDPALARERTLSSANSINIGRLLPQMLFYAVASLQHWRQHGERPGFIVPTGNLGNALACLWARDLGLPIGEIVLATNANRTIVDYWEDGEWRPRSSVATLASAMDVGEPSNMERAFARYTDHSGFAQAVRAFAVDDEAIRRRIREGPGRWGRVWCPHTATAIDVLERLGQEGAERHPWIVVATAHPAKFEGIVEPLVGESVSPPPALARLLDAPGEAATVEPDLNAVRAALL